MDKNNDILIDNMDERIESFLRGTMSAAEEAEFKREIKENTELKHRAQTMSVLIKGMHTHEALREDKVIHPDQDNNDIRVSAARAVLHLPSNRKKKPHEPLSHYINWEFEKNSSTNQEETPHNIRPLIWWTCSIAAAFIIIFGIYKVHRYNLLDATVSSYYTQYDISDISRGDLDSATVVHLYSLFTQIQKNRNMSDIIKELEPIYQSLDDDYTYHPWTNDIAWNLALAYIKDDQIDKAITILDKLKHDNPDTPICTKSDELIQKIKDLK